MVLYLSDEMDLDLRLPEIYLLLGEPLTMVFFEVFGGRTIDVPPVQKVREAFKSVSVYMRAEELRKVNSDEDALKQAAVELDLSESEAREARRRVQGVLDRLGKAVRDVAEG